MITIPRNLRQQIARWRDNLIDLDAQADDALARLHSAIEAWGEATRERRRAHAHLAHLIDLEQHTQRRAA